MDNRAVVAVCNLNQWALDFDGNSSRIIESIRIAKEAGARFRLGPELEVCGYGCEDHFNEQDTLFHCEQVLRDILASGITQDIICDIGMPVMHENVQYNCRVLVVDGHILLIRPKMFLADSGNYREGRYFSRWQNIQQVEQHRLSQLLQDITGQTYVPFGIALIETGDACIGCETCEELWTPMSPHIQEYLFGADIIGNGSGSHHQLRKLNIRVEYISSATRKCGGAYLYSNQRGCDGGRLYFDGSSLISVNGDIVAQASQFSLKEVEVITSVIDLDAIRSYRSSMASLQDQAAHLRTISSNSSSSLPVPIFNEGNKTAALYHSSGIQRVQLPYFRLCSSGDSSQFLSPTQSIQVRYHSPEEECALGPACWLWDYLRRSGASGYFLALSGGIDSSTVAVIVSVMCDLVMEHVNAGDKGVIRDVQRLCGMRPRNDDDEGDEVKNDSDNFPRSASDLCNILLHTCYMGTQNSSVATESRARTLSEMIGCYHTSFSIDSVISAVINLFSVVTGKSPRFHVEGGSHGEDIAMQNIQARLRMVLSYLFASLSPWARGKLTYRRQGKKKKVVWKESYGFLLVLGTANVDESLRGYLTKYDCSSADINPIGAISKVDLRRLMIWAANTRGLRILNEIVEAPPTAELRPLDPKSQQCIQKDEDDMGMTYEELSQYGQLRKVHRCGPVSMFRRLCDMWGPNTMFHLSFKDIGDKVKKFFFYYSLNRHKATVLTPSYHAESYSPDDNRFDLRQFLYNLSWSLQFRTIDDLVTQRNLIK